tara:strand:+ start:1535 stop:2152 length:618 start_codon:yes stop_codon:yes gene_type:complete
MHIVFKLLSPLAYLKIHHPQKRVVDFLLPTIFSALVTFILVYFSDNLVILEKDGVVESFSKLVQFLTAFYVAALAAIATFPSKNMDVPTDGTSLKLNNRVLTRRQFLSYMFGFLSIEGFTVIFLSQIAILMHDPIAQLESVIGDGGYEILRIASVFIFNLSIASLLFTTLYAVYYLTEKIHETQSTFTAEGFVSSSDEPEEEEEF